MMPDTDIVGPLTIAVRALLGDATAVLRTWSLAPLRPGSAAPARLSRLYRVEGVAAVGSSELPWSLVLKVLVPQSNQDNPADARYWRCEALLYRSGMLAELSGGLRAPRCFGVDDAADGTICLWLEHIRADDDQPWPLDRWFLAARHLGHFNAAYPVGKVSSETPWLAGRRLRVNLATQEPLVARIVAAADDPAVCQWWPRPIVDAILRLWAERDVFCEALERLPQALGHGDAIRRNLISRRRAAGSDETVAFDWEFAGHYVLGEDAGQMLSVASAFFDLDPADLPALEDGLFGAYLEGLRDGGWRGEPGHVRFAYTAHAALRNIFTAVGTTPPDDAARPIILENHGHTWEELSERRAAIRPFLLRMAAEARTILPVV